MDMIELKLSLALCISDEKLSAVFEAVPFPEGTAGEIRIVKKAEEIPQKGVFTLLVTDSKELVKDYGCAVRAVCLGREDVPAACDVWRPDEDSALLKKRCGRMLCAMADELAHKFYRDTLMTTIDTVPDMLWFKRADGIHTMVNEAFTGIVHKDREDIVGKDHFYIWDAPRPADGNDFACAESEAVAISSGKMYVCDEPVKTRDGMKQLTTYKTPLYDPFGEVYGTVGVGHDVTNFSNLGIELSILVENLPFPMLILTTEWEVVRMNSAFMAVIGSANVKDFDYLQWKRDLPVPIGKRVEDKTRHVVSREFQLNVHGEEKIFVISELEIRDFFDNITGYFCTMQDVTYQRSYERRILMSANTDMLTGMYNRRYFYGYITRSVGSSFHLLYLDLDNFKEINDGYGHSTGDEVLVKTAEMITEHFPDSTAARLGGDEFAVIVTEEDAENVQTKCEHLKKAIKREFAHFGCDTGLSVGIAYTDGTLQDMEKLIMQSDARMYEEKKVHHEV